MNRLIYKLLTFVFIIPLGMPYASQAEAPWDDAKIEKACPEEFAERTLLRAKRKPPKNVVIVSRPALRKQLLEMERDDQAAREIFIEIMKATVGELPMDSPAVQAVAHVDDINLSKLRHIVAQDGFPKVDMVGLDGV